MVCTNDTKQLVIGTEQRRKFKGFVTGNRCCLVIEFDMSSAVKEDRRRRSIIVMQIRTTPCAGKKSILVTHLLDFLCNSRQSRYSASE